MSEHTESVAAADAAGGQFARAFLPGLVLGLVIGLFIGAWLPPYLGEKPSLVPAGPASTQTPAQRLEQERGEAPAPPPASAPQTEGEPIAP